MKNGNYAIYEGKEYSVDCIKGKEGCIELRLKREDEAEAFKELFSIIKYEIENNKSIYCYYTLGLSPVRRMVS